MWYAARAWWFTRSATAARPRPEFTRFSAGRNRDRPEHGLDHDELGKLPAQGEPGIADLADEVGAVGDKLDHLILAESDFPQALLHFRRGAELANADRHANTNAAQWADFA